MLAYYNRGIGLSEKGKSEDAINDFNEAIRLNPNYGRAYYNRAMAYQKLGQGDKAKADFAEARRLGVTGPNSGNK
jgi:tetratricopeptide (TPR) repeat protein